MRHALTPYLTSVPDLEIVVHQHDTTLAEVSPGEKAIFALRDPVDRFVSGFNSRRRQGRPVHNVDWTPAEASAFGDFWTPNVLAEALSAPDDKERARAISAMQDIRHVNTSYADWLVSVDYVRVRRPHILWVGLTQRLSEDFAELLQLLGLPPDCKLPDDPRMAHRRLETDPTWLSERAVNNIQKWYAGDYAFMDYFFSLGTERAGHPQ